MRNKRYNEASQGEQTKTVQTPAEDGRRTSTRVGKEQQSAARLTRSVESPQPPEFPRAKKKADKYSQKYLGGYNVEYDAVRPTVNDKKSTEKASFYSFLPLWRYVYRYGGKNYEFYVNGQTGKAVGEAPTSLSKALVWFVAVFGSLFFTVEMLLYLLGVM